MSQPAAVEKNPDQKPEKLRLVVIDQLLTLLIGGFSLVAALAWNDAIQSLFKELFPQGGSLVYKFGYAVLVTVIIVLISVRLRHLKEQATKQ